MIQTKQNTQIQLNQNSQKTSFLGQKLNSQTDTLQTLKALQNDTIWITYRQNFSPLLLQKKNKKSQQKITTDQGWGCMLRVGQNIFIEALKRHFYKNNLKFNYHQLIQPFIDDPSANYSIHQISEIAFQNFQMVPGEWYPPNRIMKVLEILQNSQPVHNAKNLKIGSFNSDSVIVYDQILGYFLKDDFLQKPLENIQETFLCKNTQHSQLIQESKENQNLKQNQENQENQNQENQNLNQDNQNLNQENQNQKNQNQNQENQNQNQEIQNSNKKQKKLVCQQCHKSEKSLFLVINTRLGLEKINTSYQEIILEILEFELSLGIIGGQTGKAHYFIGNLDKKLLFLDPHFTQPASTKENFGNLENIQSYFCSQLRFLDIEQIDSTLSLGFYLKDLNDLEKFYQFMNQLQEKYQDFFIYFSEEVPSYIKKIYEKNDNQEGQQQEGEDDDFIILD